MNLPERTTSNELPAFAWPGGYPIIYFDKRDSVLCAKCATKYHLDTEDFDNKPVACDVFYEGATLYCEECDADIESAYGDPEADK